VLGAEKINFNFPLDTPRVPRGGIFEFAPRFARRTTTGSASGMTFLPPRFSCILQAHLTLALSAKMAAELITHSQV